MKTISLFTKWLCNVVTLLLMLLLLPMQWGMAQNKMVNGKVTFKIEHKEMSLLEAQAALDAGTAIPVKVSMIFDGEWVSLFDQGLEASFRASHFAFGIAQKEGRDENSAPLEKTAPQAYMYARSSLNCTASDGASLTAPSQPLDVCVRGSNLAWENTVCPQFAYGVGIPASSAITQGTSYLHKSADGKSYELTLFYLHFRLKSLQTIYVRGIDYNSPVGDGLIYTDDESNVKPSTVGTTMLNLQTDDGTTISWRGGPTSGNADWTLSGSTKFGQSGQSIETDYYGGIIPGGIFIEQVPVVGRFERILMA